MATPLCRSFTLEELTFSQTAARQGILNTPSSDQIAALAALCVNVLQPLRDAINLPIVVSSGFRCPALNRAVFGAAASQHMQGEAADIICPMTSTAALFKQVLELELPFDQLIYEGGIESVWVHVSFDRLRRRGSVLRASFPAGGGVSYVDLTREAALELQA